MADNSAYAQLERQLDRVIGELNATRAKLAELQAEQSVNVTSPHARTVLLRLSLIPEENIRWWARPSPVTSIPYFAEAELARRAAKESS